ncbi:hypothetical protein AMS68_002319 [Peltaster fructicola]|uniref:Diphthine--ammonia ligase n=1 Tax=Peltaster fructicola TaxID=286661 RepID=A0A6H0XPW1_9PEZI|nr:hypothetical protein AMS68_002319 [Peltaster fructicola]
MSHLNVVALVSGGKDSFFSILHCLEHGHNVVALANLYPAPVDGATVEDSDSFMYQTVGHAIIPLYERALGLPLYRQSIDGHAVSQTKTYNPQASSMHEDETEALIPLLQQVLQSHPEVNAVSTGAILSDYQRTRVESIAIRLGLTPISYLWQYPRIVTRSPVALLEDMAAAGQDSRIIKVSSGGLDSSFLWQNVADRRTTHQLMKASQRFGNADDGAALGEGGEYETLAVSGPAPLWKGRIAIGEAHREVIPGEAGTATLRLSRPTLETHHEEARAPLAQPPLLSEHFQSIFTELAEREWTATSHDSTQTTTALLVRPSFELIDPQTIFIGAQTGEGIDAASQMQSIMVAIKAILTANDHDEADIAYTSIILRDMADFPKINSVYAAAFKRPNPPARATIACAGVLDAGHHLMVSVTSTKVDLQQREGLHVQSLSYWAPANIGPYSQAITVPSNSAPDSTVTYIAGQIPLIPPTMQLDSIHADNKLKNFLHQAILSLQHLHRIALAVRVKTWKHALAFIVATDDASAGLQAAVAREVWTTSHGRVTHSAFDPEDEDEAYDIWHDRYGSNRPLIDAKAAISSSSSSDLLSRRPSALLVVRVDSLPRGASVEWVAFGSSEPPCHDLIHYRHLLDIFAGRIF